MRRAAYVLVGGRSSRMGFDKALLRWGSATLVERVASAARAAAGSVTLVGAPERYAHLGYPTLADAEANRGPLGGIVAALAATSADWNLILACDMPNVSAELLKGLFTAAEAGCAEVDCVAPVHEAGTEPLCAVYHRRALPALRAALDANRLKMQAIVRSLHTRFWRTGDSSPFRNLNTPEEWLGHG
jgi:molybdopterin-guanine dinucleotide biosynthesis protein A